MIATVAAPAAALQHNAKDDDDISRTINKQKGVKRQGHEVLTAVMDANDDWQYEISRCQPAATQGQQLLSQ